jgi:hypothetical protein
LNCIGIKVADREIEFHDEEERKHLDSNGDEAAEQPLKDDISVDQLGRFDDNLKFYLRKGSH